MAIPESNINQSPFTVATSPFLKPETPFFPQRTMIKGASVIEERDGCVTVRVLANVDFIFGSLTTITSQHCVLAHEEDLGAFPHSEMTACFGTQAFFHFH